MRALVLLALVAAGGAGAGCGRREPPAAVAVPGEARDAIAETPEALPTVRVLGDIAANGGRRVVVEGLYEIDPIAQGKGGHLTWIVLADGTRVSRWYGAVADELGFADRRVRVTGVITAGPPDTKIQALLAPHIQPERIELAPGQTMGPPDEIPAPPVASTTPMSAPRVDRWVQIVGTLEALKPTATTSRADATVKLSDGGVVRVENVVRLDWSPHVGKTVTVIGRLAMDKGAPGAFALDLVIRGKSAVCAGVVSRCGM
ncbi:MAG: hypothetical protein HYV09_22560 [Deltaproteobacteria bacterium]|nr:hypothetical protein [Deltaproteobacteria bacterium]